jgi:hypothetical protein
MNKFTIHYPNGIKRHINRLERDLLASSLIQIAPREYAAPHHSLQTEIDQINSPRYLEGAFTIEQTDGRKIHERLESVMGMTARLIKQGVLELQNDAIF